MALGRARAEGTTLAELVDRLPGARVLDDGGPLQARRLTVRGGTPAQAQVVVDGLPLAAPFSTGLDVGILGTEAIARAVNMTDNIGMIFSGIRHELGNPVNSIKTALSVLRKQHRSFGPDKTDVYLTLIMEEVSRVEFLLSSLRSYTAFERAKTEDVNIISFLHDFERLVRADLEAQGIIFEIVDEGDLSPVRIDPRALNQVLLNLVRNACDALVDMDDRRVHIVAGNAGSRMRLVVRDNGVGMSQEHIDRLFLPFHTTKERGTGLGLVIAQKLVTEMGGHLHVKSERRRGTEVTVELSRAGATPC